MMCGIVGYTGPDPALAVLLQSLHRLEYRGYDSAGVAIQDEGVLRLERVRGKIDELEAALDGQDIPGTTGIGHTRWATHGEPSEENAHPHFSDDRRIMVVHNGIIENHDQLREDLAEDHTFTSETDTEVLAHMLSERYEGDLAETLAGCIEEIEGSLAAVAIHADEDGRLVAARSGSPMIIGQGENAMYVASDLPALLDYTREAIFLDEDEVASLTPDGFEVRTVSGQSRSKAVTRINWDAVQTQKDGYKHFMLKEIHEQPRVLKDAMRNRIGSEGNVRFPGLELEERFFRELEKIVLVACGTSYHACMVARYWFEEFTDLQVDMDIASEYQYRTLQFDGRQLVMGVSQSGETADTLSTLRRVKREGVPTLALCNVMGSTMTREADGVIYHHAGPEIGVASTKCFTTQLAALFLFSLYLGQVRGEHDSEPRLLAELENMPGKMEWLLEQRERYETIAFEQFKKDDFLFLGRHLNYPIAMEGALKLKEISYIHAEGYPGGEMKHGPIALIDEEIPVVALAPKSRVYDKMISNIEETRARGGLVIGVGMQEDDTLGDLSDYMIPVPDTEELLTPILTAIPMQYLAYEIAVRRGCDVDQPRNLAKSVTVE